MRVEGSQHPANRSGERTRVGGRAHEEREIERPRVLPLG
jgi:hypothetical protein